MNAYYRCSFAFALTILPVNFHAAPAPLLERVNIVEIGDVTGMYSVSSGKAPRLWGDKAYMTVFEIRYPAVHSEILTVNGLNTGKLVKDQMMADNIGQVYGFRKTYEAPVR